jgi:hypothetical protein
MEQADDAGLRSTPPRVSSELQRLESLLLRVSAEVSDDDDNEGFGLTAAELHARDDSSAAGSAQPFTHSTMPRPCSGSRRPVRQPVAPCAAAAPTAAAVTSHAMMTTPTRPSGTVAAEEPLVIARTSSPRQRLASVSSPSHEPHSVGEYSSAAEAFGAQLDRHIHVRTPGPAAEKHTRNSYDCPSQLVTHRRRRHGPSICRVWVSGRVEIKRARRGPCRTRGKRCALCAEQRRQSGSCAEPGVFDSLADMPEPRVLGVDSATLSLCVCGVPVWFASRPSSRPSSLW